jgi:dimethylargininase
MLPSAIARRALVRGVPASFAAALTGLPLATPLDPARAQRQHAAYVAALADLGLEVVAVPADEACPDCCFVEDTAVVAGGVALLTRPGAPSRRAEVSVVGAVLARYLPVVRMEAPATLDGGDCLQLGATIYVGRSARTNEAGIAGLEAVFAPRGLRVVPVPMPAGVLHLKTVCSRLADDCMLLAEDTIAPAEFVGVRIISVPAAEAHAANVLAVGRAALVPHDAPETARRVTRAGWTVHPIDTSELRRADGALTCPSILF